MATFTWRPPSLFFLFNEGEFWQRTVPNCHNIIITSYPIT